MIEVAFVILHYLTIEDTVEAIDSIKDKVKIDNYKIIVVDNGSPNGSGKILQEKYVNDKDVNVIISNDNLGFAKGNNLGFRYALKKWKPSFVVLINNDIQVIQDDFVERIKEEYQRSRFAVLGPMVITADGKNNSSPVQNAPITKDQIISNYKKEKKLLLIERLNLFWARKLLINIKNKFRKKEIINDNYFMLRHENVVLHGCCLIFSEQYFKNHEIGLDEGTFLYHEEEILYLLMKTEGLKMVYNPDLKIFHKEDSASNEMFPNEKKKRIFKLINCIQSSERLLTICKENKYE